MGARTSLRPAWPTLSSAGLTGWEGAGQGGHGVSIGSVVLTAAGARESRRAAQPQRVTASNRQATNWRKYMVVSIPLEQRATRTTKRRSSPGITQDGENSCWRWAPVGDAIGAHVPAGATPHIRHAPAGCPSPHFTLDRDFPSCYPYHITQRVGRQTRRPAAPKVSLANEIGARPVPGRPHHERTELA